jgi:hypothetical protein
VPKGVLFSGFVAFVSTANTVPQLCGDEWLALFTNERAIEQSP